MFNYKVFIFLNSNKFIKGMNNSVYCIRIFEKILYVCLFRSNRIIGINTFNKEIISNIPINTPHGITFNSKGNLYAISMKKNSINYFEKKNKNFNLKRELVSKNIFKPVDILLIKNKLFVLNYCSSKNGLNGNIITVNEDLNKSEIFYYSDKLDKPHSVIFHRKKLYILYRSPPAIIALDMNGNCLKEVYLNEDFDPVSIYFNQDKFYITNYLNGKIGIFNDNLKFTHYIDCGNGYPTNITSLDDKIFICEEKGNRILTMKNNNFTDL